ncbi:MAG: hypothetical protein FWC07_02330 [Defluviitaleaceae bacterium]|nr:hypothetical protein [Defluviitaleaceae bacterium]
MGNAKKVIVCLAAGTLAVAYIYVGGRAIILDRATSNADFLPPPSIVLTSGRVVVPGAVSISAFDRNTAEEFAAAFFDGAEEEPTLDEFLRVFFCDACSRRCLLLTPRCVAGRMRNNQATAIHAEMFPEAVVTGGMSQ